MTAAPTLIRWLDVFMGDLLAFTVGVSITVFLTERYWPCLGTGIACVVIILWRRYMARRDV